VLMQRRRSLVLLGSLLALSACSPPGDEATDGGAGSAADAGARADAAGDAGEARDAGDAPREDGGGHGEADAGAAPTGPSIDRSDPRLHEHALLPADLDPAVRDSLEVQYAQLDTRVAPLGRLVFFLPGANNPPGAWRNHGRQLAGMGFHVVIPHYDNRWGSACSGMPSSCNANTRWEALTGEDVSTVIDVSRADSAEGRVIRMLEHLRSAHPGGDWGYYLDEEGALRGDRVIIAGISHGAASAGLFGTRRAFERVVMHSGGWGAVGASPETPIARFYGFSHTEDEQHAAHLSSWSAAGMLGAPTSIDGMAPPYGDARRLVTSVPNSYPHCSVAVHSSSPMEGGGYVFDPAWRYVYGAPG
jgi:hypothetical protein